MKKYIVILAILCVSCFSRKDENIVDLKNIDEKIYIGMSKKGVIDKIGIPKDSIMSEIIEEGNYYYRYDTNDFTGYTLKIWFDSENLISYYRID